MPTATEEATSEPTPVDLARARLLPEVFIDRHCWLSPAEGGPPARFCLWDFQREVLADIEAERRLIFLKARQLGLSWLALGYALWLTSCNRGRTVLIINRGLREAKDLLSRVKFMHQRLPAGLREPTGIDSTEHIEFPRLGSRIISVPSTVDAGSGYTAQLVIVDEWAKIPRAEEILRALLPTLSAEGTTLLGISTAKGYHNHFARSWKRALDGSSEFTPIFIPSSAHPDRDEAWHARKRREFDTDRDYHQEYPETPQEAFQLPGDAVFSEFDRARHTNPAGRPADSQWPVWRGIDFGWHYSPVYWAEIQADRTVYVFDELDAQRMTSDQLAGEITLRDRQHGLDITRVPAGVDPAGKARTSQGGTESDHAHLQRAGISVRFVEPSVPADRVRLIKRLLRDGALVINPERCPMLIEAFEQAEWRLATVQGSGGAQQFPRETYREDGYYEHYLDAIGYLLVNVFPAHGAPAGASGRRGPTATRDPYSPSEFG